jgi:hypothetical protein
MVNVETWIAKLIRVRQHLIAAAAEIDEVADEYPDARDAAADNNALKGDVDSKYTTLVEAHDKVCGWQAGGTRRRRGARRTTRRSRRN